VPSRRGVQARADQAQQCLVALDLSHLEGRGHAAGRQLAPGAAQSRGACHPQDHLQVAQAPRRFLAVGLQRIRCVFVLVVALAHLERLGHQKGMRVELGAIALLELRKQRCIAADEPGFEH